MHVQACMRHSGGSHHGVSLEGPSIVQGRHIHAVSSPFGMRLARPRWQFVPRQLWGGPAGSGNGILRAPDITPPLFPHTHTHPRAHTLAMQSRPYPSPGAVLRANQKALQQ